MLKEFLYGTKTDSSNANDFYMVNDTIYNHNYETGWNSWIIVIAETIDIEIKELNSENDSLVLSILNSFLYNFRNSYKIILKAIWY